MRPWLRTLLALLLLAGLLISAWGYTRREQWARQWHCYRVAAAESFPQAQVEIAWFENGPDRHARQGELVRKWGTGNARFDLHLARHLLDPACRDSLRETFAGELGCRKELLPRWAHYWSYRAEPEPNEQIDSILRYLDDLYSAGRPQEIPWREVLNLQAVFELLGRRERARGLSPTNWHEHYRVWLPTRPAELPQIAQPKNPFPDR